MFGDNVQAADGAVCKRCKALCDKWIIARAERVEAVVEVGGEQGFVARALERSGARVAVLCETHPACRLGHKLPQEVCRVHVVREVGLLPFEKGTIERKGAVARFVA